MRNWRLLPLVFLCSACASLSKPVSQFAVYDLGPVQSVNGEEIISINSSGISGSPGLAALDMRYRLAYKDPARVYAYTQSRWLVPPAELMSQRFKYRLNTLSDSPCKLKMELTRFEQVFDTAQDSRAVVELRATLSRTDKRTTMQQAFTAEKNAVSADANGGVTAIAGAVDQVFYQVTNWVKGAGCQTGESTSS